MATRQPPADSVGALYGAHHGWLQGWLRKKLGSAADAADLAQDTFVRVLAKRQQDDAAAQVLKEPRAYLTVIARGLLIDLWRRREIERAWLEAMAGLPEDMAPSPESQALAMETLCELDRLLSAMPEKVRRAFLMAQLDGMTYRQIGEALGVSERMIKKYMAQAMLACLMYRQESS